MAIQRLDFGTAANNDGELIRTAFPKLDSNDADLDTRIVALTADVAARTTASDVNTLIAGAAGTVTQAWSAVLDGLAALTPTAFGKSLLELVSAAALRTAISLPIASTVGRLARYTDTAGAQGQTAGLYEDGTGKVGVGTTSPSTSLHVLGTMSAQSTMNSNRADVLHDGDGVLLLNTSNLAAVYDFIAFRGTNYTGSGIVNFAFDTAWQFKSNGDSMRFVLNGVQAASIGQTGFSTSNDKQFLFSSDGNPAGTPDTGIARYSSGIVKITNGSSGDGLLYCGGSGNNYFGGNVGIGLTGPAFKLDIDGPARVKTYTVATLPSASLGDGAAAFVSDANATLAAGHGNVVAGSGSNFVPVYSRSGSWYIG